jgi:fucose 4-O-acetylase-like acetyltransferase
MRGLGILLVVAGHFDSRVFTSEWIEGLRNLVYLFHMPLFMAISGILYARSRPLSFGALARKKFLRLMVPYAFVSGVILLAKSFAPIIHFPLLYPVAPGDFLAFLFYPHCGFAVFLWFLYTLFIIFCLVRALEIAGIPVWVLFLLALGLHFVPLPRYFCLDLVGANLVYFVFGMGMKEIWKGGGARGKNAGWAAGCLAGFAWLAWLVLAKGYSMRGLSVLAALAGILSCWFLALCWGGGRISPLAWLGDASSTIYLLHTLCMGGVRYVWEQGLGVETQADQILFFASSVAVAVAFPALLQRVVLDRVPRLSLALLGAAPRRIRA